MNVDQGDAVRQPIHLERGRKHNPFRLYCELCLIVKHSIYLGRGRKRSAGLAGSTGFGIRTYLPREGMETGTLCEFSCGFLAM